MPLLYINVPEANRADLVAALKQLNPSDAEVVEETDQPGSPGLRFDDMVDPTRAAHRVGDILDAAQEIAGRPLGAFASTEVGWGPGRP